MPRQVLLCVACRVRYRQEYGVCRQCRAALPKGTLHPKYVELARSARARQRALEADLEASLVRRVPRVGPVDQRTIRGVTFDVMWNGT